MKKAKFIFSILVISFFLFVSVRLSGICHAECGECGSETVVGYTLNYQCPGSPYDHDVSYFALKEVCSSCAYDCNICYIENYCHGKLFNIQECACGTAPESCECWSLWTYVELSSFTATPSDRKVIVEWTTESEIVNAGFNLYRADSEAGEYVKINSSLIPAKGSPTSSTTYQFIDDGVKNRATYYYKLEDIDLKGTNTMHGPVSATPRVVYGTGR